MIDNIRRYIMYKLFWGLFFFMKMFILYGKTPKQVKWEIENSEWTLIK
jgi:hypothetical protein